MTYAVSTPTTRHDRYIRQVKSSNSPLQNYPYDHDVRDRNTVIQPISLAKDALDYTKRENYKMHEDLRVNIDVSEHISDRLHKTAQLLRKSRYSRKSIQSDLSDYTSSTLSLVRIPDQISNPSCEHITFTQPHNQYIIQLLEKSQKFYSRASVYHNLV